MSSKQNGDEVERVNGRWKDGRVPKVLCSARRTNGEPCNRPPIKGSNVCSTHGGRAPQVRAAAQVRILMSSDLAVAKLVKLLTSKDERVVLAAAKDLADRANLAGVQNVQIGVEQPKSFLDFVGDALVDLDHDDDDDPNVWDAEVIEGDDTTPLVPREEQNRHDRAVFAEVERTQVRRARPGAMTNEQRARAEADLLAEQRHAESQEQRADVTRNREAMLLAKENGTWNPSSRGEAMREAAKESGGKRRARIRDGGMGEG